MDDGTQIQSNTFKADTDSLSYVIIVNATPPGIDVSNWKSQLDSMQKGFIKGSRTTLQSSKAIQMEQWHGREATMVAAAQKAAGRARFYVTPKFFYQIVAAGPADNIKKQSAQITKVFDSFRILPQ